MLCSSTAHCSHFSFFSIGHPPARALPWTRGLLKKAGENFAGRAFERNRSGGVDVVVVRQVLVDVEVLLLI